jgi:hypothetical protein
VRWGADFGVTERRGLTEAWLTMEIVVGRRGAIGGVEARAEVVTEVLRGGVVLAQAEMGPEDGQSGSSVWRHLKQEGEGNGDSSLHSRDAPWLGSQKKMLGQLLRQLEASRRGSRWWRPVGRAKERRRQ